MHTETASPRGDVTTPQLIRFYAEQLVETAIGSPSIFGRCFQIQGDGSVGIIPHHVVPTIQITLTLPLHVVAIAPDIFSLVTEAIREVGDSENDQPAQRLGFHALSLHEGAGKMTFFLQARNITTPREFTLFLTLHKDSIATVIRRNAPNCKTESLVLN